MFCCGSSHCYTESVYQVRMTAVVDSITRVGGWPVCLPCSIPPELWNGAGVRPGPSTEGMLPLPLQPTDQTESWLGPRTLACFLIDASENLLFITDAATTCSSQVPQVPVLPSRMSAQKGNFVSWRVRPKYHGCLYKHQFLPRFKELVRKHCFNICCFYCCCYVLISKCAGRR